MDPVPEPEPEGTWILKQNRNTRVAVDWHNVMEVNDVVSLKSIAAVQGLLDNGYQVFMVCFCGPPQTTSGAPEGEEVAPGVH